MGEALEGEPSYQLMLRAVGAYIDIERPRAFSVVEVGEGLWLLLDSEDEDVLHEVRLERETLMRQGEQLVRGRTGRADGSAVIVSVAPREGRYQDLLRALGYQLDKSEARHVLLSAAKDGLFITYSTPDRAGGIGWRQQMALLGQGEIEMVLEAARERREQQDRTT